MMLDHYSMRVVLYVEKIYGILIEALNLPLYNENTDDKSEININDNVNYLQMEILLFLADFI